MLDGLGSSTGFYISNAGSGTACTISAPCKYESIHTAASGIRNQFISGHRLFFIDAGTYDDSDTHTDVHSTMPPRTAMRFRAARWTPPSTWVLDETHPEDFVITNVSFSTFCYSDMVELSGFTIYGGLIPQQPFCVGGPNLLSRSTPGEQFVKMRNSIFINHWGPIMQETEPSVDVYQTTLWWVNMTFINTTTLYNSSIAELAQNDLFLRFEDVVVDDQVSANVIDCTTSSGHGNNFYNCSFCTGQLYCTAGCTGDCHVSNVQFSEPCVNDGVCVLEGGCECGAGFMGDICEIEIDECELGTHDCASNCTNTYGSYVCTCLSGFTGNGTVCTDINECEDEELASICDTDTTECSNTVGSFVCIHVDVSESSSSSDEELSTTAIVFIVLFSFAAGVAMLLASWKFKVHHKVRHAFHHFYHRVGTP